ncbi:MAG: hypothetical protein FDZ75_04975 [Actinobacteria bacterium]|nr:MAG: hypothetical protein FDZ75_04975 [Actinomycetota bacterium]
MQAWLDSLRTLVRDPSSNFAALGTLITIVVILVIVLVLVMVAFSLPVRTGQTVGESATQATPRARRANRAVAWLTGLAIFVIGLGAAAALWYQATSSNEYCTRTCHAMAEPSRTWEASPHASVSCVRCHEGVAWTSMGTGLYRRSRSIYYQISGRRAPRTTVPQTICLSCHEGLLDDTLTARNGEQFRHRDIVEPDTDCASCHGPQGHEPAR